MKFVKGKKMKAFSPIFKIALIFSFFPIHFSNAQTAPNDEQVIVTDQARQISMTCGDVSVRITCGIRPHFSGEEGYRRCNDNTAEMIHKDGSVSKLEFDLDGAFKNFFKKHTPVGLSCIKTKELGYVLAVETSIGFCGGKCAGGGYFNSAGDKVEIYSLDETTLVRGGTMYIEEGYDRAAYIQNERFYK